MSELNFYSRQYVKGLDEEVFWGILLSRKITKDVKSESLTNALSLLGTSYFSDEESESSDSKSQAELSDNQHNDCLSSGVASKAERLERAKLLRTHFQQKIAELQRDQSHALSHEHTSIPNDNANEENFNLTSNHKRHRSSRAPSINVIRVGKYIRNDIIVDMTLMHQYFNSI